ncbi:FHA domain-containing protein FhaB/FipA [Leucobacter sp. GX24907]
MSELTLMILRIGFLVLLWFFIFAIVYALRSDLFGAPVRRMKDEKGGGSGGPSVAAVSASPSAALPASPAASPAASTTLPSVTPSGGALPSAGGSGPARNLVITDGIAAGTSIPLDEDVLTIGRSGDSTLVIVDEYTSTYHARLNRVGDGWTLTDLDSTNGTKVSGSRITNSVPLPPFTPVTIGTTTFELRP